MLLLGRAEVEDLLDVDALIDALAEGMVDLSRGRASVPARNGAMVAEEDGLLAAMPGYTPAAGALAAKLVSLFPRNAEIGIPTHQAVIAVFDPRTGSPAALMDGTAITAVRTAAGAALATRLLAREEARTLAILGTGVQARTHADALMRVRSFEDVRVAGRTTANVDALVAELAARGLPARAAAGWEQACEGADVVCATVHPTEPVVRREWLAPGAHVTSVGFAFDAPEVDEATVADALVAVESRAAVLASPPAGSVDLRGPLAQGLIEENDLVEIGELIEGTRDGRTDPDQITLYKSVGVAVQDGVAAALVLAAARERGMGREVEL